MGKASRRKRERRSARPAIEPSGVERGIRELDGAEPESQDGSEEHGQRWGGRRVGAGRPRVYATAAERQAAYRARQRAVADTERDATPEGKPPEGGAPAADDLVARDPCA